MTQPQDPAVISPREALQRLADGNRRFREGFYSNGPRAWNPQFATQDQRPFAIVLGCSDSRTPVEILFDQGFGDLFVVRVAGNVVAPSIVGSIEFAAAQFGSQLVVVMGHTHCGAISATMRSLLTGESHASRNIRSITDRIAPHITGIVSVGDAGDQPTADIYREAMRANVRASADALRHGSQVLEELVSSGRLAVVPAEYEIDTGAVQFLDGVGTGS
jgi:carbonic anhydrase